MWTLTSNDLQSAKERLVQRRTELAERYAEEIAALDNEVAEIESVERVASDFFARHPKTEPAATADAAAPEAETEGMPQLRVGAGAGVADGKNGSRWRLHFGGPLAEQDGAASGPR